MTGSEALNKIEEMLLSIGKEMASRKMVIDPMQYKVLEEVRDALSTITTQKIKASTQLYQVSPSGGAVVIGPELMINEEGISTLANLLQHCTTLSSSLYTDNSVDIAVTVPNVQKELEVWAGSQVPGNTTLAATPNELSAFHEMAVLARDQLLADMDAEGIKIVYPEIILKSYQQRVLDGGIQVKQPGYEPNGDNLERLICVYAFFRAYADNLGYESLPFRAEPTPLDVTFAVEVDDLELTGDLFTKFRALLPEISRLRLFGTERGTITIEVCVKDVFHLAIDTLAFG